MPIIPFPTPLPRVNSAPPVVSPPAPKPCKPAVAPDMEARKSAHRKDMLGKIHMAKGHLMATKPGYTEDVYRATLEDLYGVTSAADLTPEQMHGLLLHFSRLGWQKTPRKGAGRVPNAHAHDASGQSREALLQKIEAMLTEKGKAEGTAVPWAYAVGILKRQSGNVTKSLDQATREQLADIIAALWRDAKRKGRRVR